MRKNVKGGSLVLFFALIAIIFAPLIPWRRAQVGSPATPPIAAIPASEQSLPRSQTKAIGYVGEIRSNSGESLAARSEGDFRALLSMVVANDTIGIQKMVGNGSLIELPNGVQVRVLGFGAGTHVRVESGTFYGDDVWVVEDNVR